MADKARNYDAELKNLREEAQKLERTKIQLETQKEESTKRKAQYEQECEDLGVDPLKLSSEIEKLEDEIEKVIAAVKSRLPKEAVDEDAQPAF